MSEEQAASARARVAEVYDAIVPVEMVEAVGEECRPTCLETLDARQAPGGRAVARA